MRVVSALLLLNLIALSLNGAEFLFLHWLIQRAEHINADIDAYTPQLAKPRTI